jgi:hypothetical protein
MKPEPTTSEWRGAHSGVDNKGEYVAKTQAEWEKIWNATHSNRIPAPTAPKLPEDKMAIAIFLGSRSQPADINVTDISEDASSVNVKWEFQGRSSMLAVMNEPFLLRFVDKSDKDVTFTNVPPAPKSTPARKFGF